MEAIANGQVPGGDVGDHFGDKKGIEPRAAVTPRVFGRSSGQRSGPIWAALPSACTLGADASNLCMLGGCASCAPAWLRILVFRVALIEVISTAYFAFQNRVLLLKLLAKFPRIFTCSAVDRRGDEHMKQPKL